MRASAQRCFCFSFTFEHGMLGSTAWRADFWGMFARPYFWKHDTLNMRRS